MSLIHHFFLEFLAGIKFMPQDHSASLFDCAELKEAVEASNVSLSYSWSISQCPTGDY